MQTVGCDGRRPAALRVVRHPHMLATTVVAAAMALDEVSRSLGVMAAAGGGGDGDGGDGGGDGGGGDGDGDTHDVSTVIVIAWPPMQWLDIWHATQSMPADVTTASYRLPPALPPPPYEVDASSVAEEKSHAS